MANGVLSALSILETPVSSTSSVPLKPPSLHTQSHPIGQVVSVMADCPMLTTEASLAQLACCICRHSVHPSAIPVRFRKSGQSQILDTR